MGCFLFLVVKKITFLILFCLFLFVCFLLLFVLNGELEFSKNMHAGACGYKITSLFQKPS